jgi:integrase
MQKVWFRKQTGWWYATVRKDGARQQLPLVKAPNDRAGKKLAEEQLVRELALHDHLEDSSDKAPAWATVGHVVTAFLRHSEEDHEAVTARWYRDLLLPFREMWGKLRVTRLRKKHVRAWLKAKGYNPTSANKAVGAVKRAFNWAVEEEHIPKNPVAHLRKPKALTRDRTLTPDERTLVLSAIRDLAFRRFVNAMTLTGCRPGEVARVTAADVDFEYGLWVLQKHKTAKKTGKPRRVFLPPEAVELTRELAAAHPEGPLFLNARGKPWTRNAVRIRFRRLREKHPELKGVIAYTYRASFATDALEAQVPDATVAALLGHTTTATLHRFYNRLSGRVEHLKDAATRATRPPKEAGGAPPGIP